MELDVEALYRRYGDMVLGRCLTLLRNEADAHEAAQEVFLRIHRYRSSFRGDAKPSTFLYRVTTNHCLNLIRTRGRRREDPVEDIDLAPDTTLDLVELRELLEHLLEGLDERTREAVVYRYVDGMTLGEVGDLLGVTEAAIRKRLKNFHDRVAEARPRYLDPLDR